MIELKEERETYLVDPAIASELPGEVKPMMVYTAINRQGVLFLWPVRLPGDERRRDEWSRSAHEAATIAEKTWARIVANMSLGAYEVFKATCDTIPEPTWPDKSFGELLEIAFRERFIRDVDHEVIRQLLGKA
jgi:hypothetical protein